MEKKEQKLIKKLFVALLPIQAVAVGLPAVNELVNSLIVGSAMGPEATAAIGFVGPYTLFVSAIGCTLSGGSQLMCGRSLGSGDKKGLRTVFTTTILLCVIAGAIITLLTQFCPEFIAKLVQASAESMELTTEYIKGIGIGAMFIMLVACLIPFLQIDHAGTICTISVIVQLVFNIGSTLLCVYVIKNGLYGVGFATSIANIFASAIAFIYLQAKSSLFRFDMKYFDLKAIKHIAYSGSPNAIDPICSLLRDIFANNLFYASGGTMAVAAKTLANSLATSIGSFIDGGYAGAARIIGSVLVGERDTSSLRDLTRVMVESTWYLYVGAYVIVFFMAGPIASLFVSDPESIAFYTLIIRLYNTWFFTSIFKSPPVAIYQAMDRIVESTALTILNKLVFPVGLGLLFRKLLGLPLVTLMFPLPEVLLIITMAIMFTVKAKRPPRSLTELCYIPSTYSAPRENRYKAVVCTVDEACKASKDVTEFCKSKGMDAQRAYYCGLSVEEILTDIINNRFKTKDNIIDLRVMYEDGGISILVRDNCEEFDTIKWVDCCSPEDAEKSLGIKMVKQVSKKMEYIFTLGLNVLTIKL